MTTPRTQLDSRFSDPDAQPTSWEQTLAEINRAELFWISTVRADGRPHVTPLVAVWLDDALHFSTGPDEQKALNIAADSHVALTDCALGQAGLVDRVGTVVSPLPPSLACLARIPAAVFRRPIGFQLPFLSSRARLGSLESTVRR